MAVKYFEGPGILSFSLMPFLLKEDLIPEECTGVQIDFPVGERAVKITYVVNLTDGRLKAFHRAFTAYLEHVKNSGEVEGWGDPQVFETKPK